MAFQPVPGFTKPQNQFMHWLYVNHPQLYSVGIQTAKNYARNITMRGLGFDWSSIGDMFSKVVDTVKGAAPGILQIQQQKKLLDLQIAKAKAGQAPLTAAQYAAYATPAVAASAEAQGQPVNVQPYGHARAKTSGLCSVDRRGLYGAVLVHSPSDQRTPPLKR